MQDLYELSRINRNAAEQCHRTAVAIIEDAHISADKALKQADEYQAIADAASAGFDWLESLPADAVVGEFEIIDLQWRIR